VSPRSIARSALRPCYVGRRKLYRLSHVISSVTQEGI